ncbi:MAG TPA: RCC1 domain-containing protein, partial [Polyangiaceae bacterium]|nr:RCC1 domain-containing protein [Polyangiaceae bacterium]
PGVLDSVDLGGHSALQVAAGKSHTCAILDNGALKCWGSNSAGQLGLGDLQNRGDSGGKLSADTTVDLVF